MGASKTHDAASFVQQDLQNPEQQRAVCVHVHVDMHTCAHLQKCIFLAMRATPRASWEESGGQGLANSVVNSYARGQGRSGRSSEGGASTCVKKQRTFSSARA